MHTFLMQVYLEEKKAYLIDPSRSELVNNNNKSKARGKKKIEEANWLDATFLTESGRDRNGCVFVDQTEKTNREVIQNFLKLHYDVKEVRFGSDGHGAAFPANLFKQFPNTCNTSVTLGLFWLAVGYEKIPRFPKNLEQALFCRLLRAADEKTLPLIAKKTFSKIKDLKSAILQFI